MIIETIILIEVFILIWLLLKTEKPWNNEYMRTEYRSHLTKIYYDTNEELWEKVSRLGAVSTEEIIIKNCMPDITTTKRCSSVYYYKWWF